MRITVGMNIHRGDVREKRDCMIGETARREVFWFSKMGANLVSNARIWGLVWERVWVDGVSYCGSGMWREDNWVDGSVRA
ncbi:hypothetical protein A2U01_0030192, partial [Trifolium medium]|nr:hypothetical protein [Trifolium medium]